MRARPHPKPQRQLAEIIGYRFDNEGYFSRALVHSSYIDPSAGMRPKNFERLEFVGDRVLGLVIAELLFAKFPDSDEGGLASRFNMLVRKETCAHVAREIDLGAYLLMSNGEADAGGRSKKAILGNACEALIAAIYMDGGLPAARTFIEKYWLKLLDQVERPPQDAKTALQEWAQSKGLAPPFYQLDRRDGPDHEPLFSISVSVTGYAPETGEGGSKRLAEQAAATALLLRESVWQDD